MLVAAGLNRISISAHSHTAAVHDELTGVTSWRAAVRAAALAVETGISTSFTCVVTRRNAEHVAAVAEMAVHLGVGILVLNSFHATGQGADKENLELPDGEFKALVDLLRRTAGKQIKILVGSPPGSVANGSRRSANRITISPFGEVKLCNHSTVGVTDILRDPHGFETFLDALSRNECDEYLSRVDNCACPSSEEIRWANLTSF
jgi:MoaA/NifB/PqqE/SkfB family radical SAM enzyme